MSDGAVRIGTSGYVYPSWRGPFYPSELKRKDWLSYYSQRFDTVELNSTFYRLAKAAEARQWRQAVPQTFEFAVKGSRFITHMLKLRNAELALERFMYRLRGLGPRLGPLLFQLPPHLKCDEQRLETFLHWFVRRRRHLVFEFRETSWYQSAVFRLLERHGCSLCWHDMAGSENDKFEIGPLRYVRCHGVGARYGGSYSEQRLAVLASRVQRWRAAGLPVYVYFNNDVHGYAVQNAQSLKALIG